MATDVRTEDLLKRGFCHLCQAEVRAQEMEDGNFQCSSCLESTVECPYESLENWEGGWRFCVAEATFLQLDISSDGAVTVTRHPRSFFGEGEHRCHLRWAPSSDDHYNWQLDMPDVRCRFESPNQEVFGAQQTVLETGEVSRGTMHRSSSETEEEEEESEYVDLLAIARMFRFGSARSSNSGPAGQPNPQSSLLMNAIASLDALHPQVFQHFRGDLDLVESIFEIAMRRNAREAALQPERLGASRTQVRHWLAGAAIEHVAGLESDWQCPICFDGCTDDLVAMCKDDDGKPMHYFHSECVSGWLVRRDECPTCRRTPIVCGLTT